MTTVICWSLLMIKDWRGEKKGLGEPPVSLIKN